MKKIAIATILAIATIPAHADDIHQRMWNQVCELEISKIEGRMNQTLDGMIGGGSPQALIENQREIYLREIQGMVQKCWPLKQAPVTASPGPG